MHQAFNALRDQLAHVFPERLNVIEGALAAILAGEHVLLLGPPGTAKSALVRALAQAFGGRYFERLLTKFSTPDEIFGPISLRALEQDRFERVTTGQLPEAELAFVDEVFKASSAILNTLLTIMNERRFTNGGAPVACPLISLFGASNELPEGRELEALFDRFLLRFDVGYLLQPRHLRRVLLAPEPSPTVAVALMELRVAQAAVLTVTITDPTVDALLAIREACQLEGIVASDRRWKKALRLVQATAFLAGAAETSPEDLVVLTDMLWREPKDRPKVARLVGRLADPVGLQATEILDAARETAGKVGALRTTDRKQYITVAAQALDQFAAERTRLEELGQTAGSRALGTVKAARDEIQAMHEELARTLSAGLGLRRAAS